MQGFDLNHGIGMSDTTLYGLISDDIYKNIGISGPLVQLAKAWPLQP